MSTPKKALCVLWGLCLLATLVPSGSFIVALGVWIFRILVVVHAIECVVFLKELRSAPGPLGNQLVQTFLFGIVHMQEIRAARDDSTPTP